MSTPQIGMPGPTVGGFGAGAMTFEDPMAARKKTLLARFEQAAANEESAEQAWALAIEGNKGVKTVAAFSFFDLSAGPSPTFGEAPYVNTKAIQLPPGKISVFTFDGQTIPSLKKRYGAARIEEWKKHPTNPVEFVPIMEIFDFQMRDGQSAVDLVDGLCAILEKWAKSEKRACILMDRWDIYTDIEVLRAFTHHKAKKPISGDIEMKPSDWGTRNNMLSDTLGMLRRAVRSDGGIILTGEEDKNEGDNSFAFVPDPKDPSKKTVAFKTVASKWLGRPQLKPHISARVRCYVGDEVKGSQKTGRQVRYAETEFSRIPWLPSRYRVALDGRHLGAFQDHDSLMPMEHDAEPMSGPQVSISANSVPSPHLFTPNIQVKS